MWGGSCWIIGVGVINGGVVVIVVGVTVDPIAIIGVRDVAAIVVG